MPGNESFPQNGLVVAGDDEEPRDEVENLVNLYAQITDVCCLDDTDLIMSQ